uniref:Uncharacterized protein n=1 Tax=Ciona intestinalis TaxID=7719 RepID=H2XVF5_CIOIN
MDLSLARLLCTMLRTFCPDSLLRLTAAIATSHIPSNQSPVRSVSTQVQFLG